MNCDKSGSSSAGSSKTEARLLLATGAPSGKSDAVRAPISEPPRETHKEPPLVFTPWALRAANSLALARASFRMEAISTPLSKSGAVAPANAGATDARRTRTPSLERIARQSGPQRLETSRDVLGDVLVQ